MLFRGFSSSKCPKFTKISLFVHTALTAALSKIYPEIISENSKGNMCDGFPSKFPNFCVVLLEFYSSVTQHTSKKIYMGKRKKEEVSY